MSRRFALSAILFALICGRSAAQQSETFAGYNLPGRLATFLKTVPNASSATKPLGELSGFQEGMGAEFHVTGRVDVIATFTAVAASSPADSSLKAKGIEVRFEYWDAHQDKKPFQVVYLDDEGLGFFHDRLGDLAEIRSFALTHLGDSHPEEFPTCIVAPAINRVTGTEERFHQKIDKAIVLSAGWYWTADETVVGAAETGLCIDVDPGVASFFPNATLDQLAAIVAKGRAFLAAN